MFFSEGEEQDRRGMGLRTIGDLANTIRDKDSSRYAVRLSFLRGLGLGFWSGGYLFYLICGLQVVTYQTNQESDEKWKRNMMERTM
jgi:hypothetical protein